MSSLHIPRQGAVHPLAVLLSLILMTIAVVGVVDLAHKVVTGHWQ